MTGEEMERAIEFLLKNQASFDARLEKTNQQLERTTRQGEETDRRLSMLAETQSEFTRTMLGHVEAQAEINADVRRTMKELSEAQRQTQQDLSELMRVVNGLARKVYGDGNPPQG